MNNSDLVELINYIQEKLRTTRSSKIKFIDPKNFKRLLLAKQNHVIFGRRGAGKTTLVLSLENEGNTPEIIVNLEKYKDISFPKIVVKILIEVFKKLNELLRENLWFFSWSKFNLTRKISTEIEQLNEILLLPDEETREIKETEKREISPNISIGNNTLFGKLKSLFGFQKETQRKLDFNKLEILRTNIAKYEKILMKVNELVDSDGIFLVFDDFYFLKKEIQPDFIDYFHYLTKSTEWYIKLATIRHRSKLYSDGEDTIRGVEVGADVQEIDMDYSLDDFEALKSFMWNILEQCNNESNANIELEAL